MITVRKPSSASFGRCIGAREGPPGARDFELSGGNLFAGTLDRAAADPVALGSKLSVIHPVAVVGVISDRSLSRFFGCFMPTIALAGPDHLLNLTLP